MNRTLSTADPLEPAGPLRELRFSQWRMRRTRLVRAVRRSPAGVVGVLLLIVLIGAALGAPYLALADPMASHGDHLRQPPSARFPFGTDELGRDILSRVLYGARISLQVGILTTALALGTGVVLGMAAATGGRWLSRIILRLMELVLAFPRVLLALAIVAILGPSLMHSLLAVALSLIPGYVRTVRSLTLSLRNQEFVLAARALGVDELTILWRHLLPNLSGPVIVLGTLGIADITLEMASLSFIGLGAQPPTPEWGAMLSSARTYLRDAWWMAAFPGLAITLTVLAVNLAGDWLRDLLDPRAS